MFPSYHEVTITDPLCWMLNVLIISINVCAQVSMLFLQYLNTLKVQNSSSYLRHGCELILEENTLGSQVTCRSVQSVTPGHQNLGNLQYIQNVHFVLSAIFSGLNYSRMFPLHFLFNHTV